MNSKTIDTTPIRLRTPAAANNWRGVTYGNGLYVAVSDNATTGTNGVQRVMTSPNGISWTIQTGVQATIDPVSSTKVWFNCAYGNSVFVTSGSSTTQLMSSANGTTWAERSKSHSNGSYIIYGNGRFLIIGPYITHYSTTGASTWGSTSSNRYEHGIVGNWSGYVYGGTTLIAVSYDNSDHRIMRSTNNGQTFTLNTSFTGFQLTSITYGNSLFVSVGNSGKIITSSNDGVAWTERTSGTTNKLNSIAFGNNMFVAVGNNIIVTSTNGTSWTTRSSPANVEWLNITYGTGGRFVAVGNSNVMTINSSLLT